tara:strand:+ start:286 stop:939 length:654 start_codon:yes stop_codon:yes gene_type:complete
MKYFQKLPIIFDEVKLVEALKQVEEIAPWPEGPLNEDKAYHQICLTKKYEQTVPECFYQGSGGTYRTMIDGREVIRQQKLNEKDYCVFIPELNHTYFREVYDTLNEFVKKTYDDSSLGRVRLIKSKPRTSLSWHRDPEPRLHVPIVSNIGAKMIIEDEVQYLSVGRAWYTNTIYYHSQFNGGEEDRVHLVTSITANVNKMYKYNTDWNEIKKGNDYY